MRVVDENEDYEWSEDDLLVIQENYQRKRLIEALIGPVISTVFHVLLIIILAIFITDKVKEPIAEIEVTMEEVEEVELEEPPMIEEPEPVEQTEDTTNPVLTTVAVENVETNDKALEDVSDEAPSTDDNMSEEAVSDVVISPSAFASPSVYGGRSASGRASAVSKFGGTKVGQASLLKALWWLAKVQNPDGSWGTIGQSGLTGLALLTFLAHGETPTSKQFGKTVKKAMVWLVNDPIEINKLHGYPHAVKTYALAEAYAMTGISMLEDKMNQCVRILIDGQQNGGCYDYNYKKNEERQDLSFAGWNFQALKAAYGAGCEENGLTDAIYKAIEWLKKNTADEAVFPYSTSNNVTQTGKATHTMRAVGVLCLQLFGEGKTVEIKDDLKSISKIDLKNYDWNKAPHCSLYGWYYATQAMFQQGGHMWRNWNRKFQKELTENQHPEGYWEYPGTHWVSNFDDLSRRVYATTLCALQLTVYYRYLPSSKGTIGGKEGKQPKKEALPKEEGLNLID